MQKIVLIAIALIAANCGEVTYVSFDNCRNSCKSKVLADKGTPSLSQATKYTTDDFNFTTCYSHTGDSECSDFNAPIAFGNVNTDHWAKCANKCGPNLESDYMQDVVKCMCADCANNAACSSNILYVSAMILLALLAF